MPKIFGRNVPPIVLIGGAVAAVWLGMGAMQQPDPTAPAKKTNPAAKTTTADVDYQPSDFKATFASLKSSPPSDVFRPLFGKTSDLNVKNQSIDNFSYSGMATLNNTAQGLLENSQTGEGDFVETGQHWHQNWLVVSLSPDSISLRNVDTGEDTTLKAGANEKTTTTNVNPRVASGAGNMPFNPTMIGQIGGDMTIQSDAGNGTTINTAGGPGGRGRGRGRGGRRGGGGGGNGGGGPQGD